jgi:NADH:ubiquinone oxidoreductase subunit 3 (subunit A)
MSIQYFHVLLFALVGLAFGLVVFLTAWLVRLRGTRDLDMSAYECGMRPVGGAWASPNIRFYRFALLFVIFDVEALFVFPWAVQFRELGWTGYADVLIFVGVLLIGLLYAGLKGALKWE